LWYMPPPSFFVALKDSLPPSPPPHPPPFCNSGLSISLAAAFVNKPKPLLTVCSISQKHSPRVSPNRSPHRLARLPLEATRNSSLFGWLFAFNAGSFVANYPVTSYGSKAGHPLDPRRGRPFILFFGPTICAPALKFRFSRRQEKGLLLSFFFSALFQVFLSL